MDLMKILNLTLPKVQLIFDAAFKTATKIQPTTVNSCY
jgi:hypothetical protein